MPNTSTNNSAFPPLSPMTPNVHPTHLSTPPSTSRPQSSSSIPPSTLSLSSPLILSTPNSNSTNSTNSTNTNNSNNPNPSSTYSLQWSKYLSTPCTPLTTPSLSTSYHGLGLSVAHSRSIALTDCGKLRSALLSSLSDETSLFASKILKSSETLSKSLQNYMERQEYNKKNLTVDPVLLQFSQSLISFSKQTQFLSITLKSSCVRPMSSESISHGSSSSLAYEEYQKSRKVCVKVRGGARKARGKYERFCEEVERGVEEVGKLRDEREKRDGREGEEEQSWNPLEMLTSDSLKKSVKALYSSLSSVQQSETAYRLSVEDDNASTLTCSLTEKSSLKTLEILEGDRLLSFIQNLDRLVLAENGAVQNMRAAISRISVTSNPVLPILPVSTTFPEYVNIEEEGAINSAGTSKNAILPNVLSEGEASNLPKMVSQLRSDIFRFYKRGTTATQALLAVRTCLTEIQRSLEAFKKSLGDFLNAQGYPCGDSKTLPTIDGGTLAVMVSKAEGQLSFKAWSCVASSISSQVRQAGVLVKTLDSMLSEEGGSLALSYLNSEQTFFKSLKENLDREWKQLCEQGRLQGKAETRYKIAETNLNASKERLETVQKELSTSPTSMTTDASSEGENFVGVRKAIGHVLSSLGTGDEAISKVVSTKERMEMVEAQHGKAKTQLREASKHLEDTTSKGSERLKTHVSHFETTFKKLSSKENEISEKARQTIQNVKTALTKFLDGREASIKEAADMVSKIQSNNVLNDRLTWARKMEKKIKKKYSQAAELRKNNGDDEPDDASVYDLKVRLHPSQKLYALLKDIFDYNPEDFDSKELTESEVKEVKMLTELLEQVKTEEELEEKKNGGTSKQKEQQTFEKNFEGMFLTPTNDTPPKDGGEDKKEDDDEEDGSDDNDDENKTEENPNPNLSPTSVPTVIESFSCAYWPQSDEITNLPSPLLHGRMFVTAAGLYFVGWGKFKLILEFERIKETKKQSTLSGAVDNALLLVCDDGKEYFFGSFAFRENCHRLIDRLRSVKGALIDAGMVLPSTTTKKKKDEEPSDDDDDDDDDDIDDVTPIPFSPCTLSPDAHVKRMTVVCSETLKGFNIQQYFNTFWRDKPGGVMFYGPWLEEKGAKKVGVTKWEKKKHDHKYSKETFNMQRVATFDYPRTTHLWMGPPMAGVMQTQFCRIDDGSRCIVVMTVEMNGIPYADVFAVEVRWVATNIADKVIEVEVGVAVDMKKSSMFKSQIKSGTEEETGSIHRGLFESMKKKAKEMGEDMGDDDDDGVVANNSSSQLMIAQASKPVNRSLGIEERVFVGVLLLAILVVFWDLRQQKLLVRELVENTKTLQNEIGLLVQELKKNT